MNHSPLEISRIELEKIRVWCGQALYEADVGHQDLEIDSWINPVSRQFIIQMETYLMGLVDERIEIHREWPRTWWDALKDRWFPEWAKRRWPVAYDGIHVSKKTYKKVCPHIRAPHREDRMCFNFFTAPYLEEPE